MQIIEHYNPFNLSEIEVIELADRADPVGNGEAFIAWYAGRYGNGEGVEHIYVNGFLMLYTAGAADVVLEPGSEIRIVMHVGDPLTIIAYTFVALSLAAVTLIPQVNTPSQGAVSPTYNLAAQQNQARLGATIPIHYGTVRAWPDLAAQPYKNYSDNQQYVYQLFCIGAGEFDFENLQIEDTDVTSFDEVEYEYYYNAPVTLFPTSVISSGEPASQILSTSTTGPFNANGAGTEANRLEIDITFPNGLHRARSSGDIESVSVTILVEYREIDGAGAPVGSWVNLYNAAITRAERAPVRLTVGAAVTAGRYEVRVSRGNTETTGPKIYDRVTWEGLRAFMVDEALTYTGKTMLAVRAKATANLTANSQRRFNVVATRKLPTYTGSPLAWSAVTATSEIAWALADVIRNAYGAGQVDSRIDLDQLLALDTVWQGRGDEFNFRFDTPITLWEVLTTIARAGRAFPVRNNNVISFVRSTALSVPTALFNKRNIVRDSIRVEYNLNEEETHDAISAKYIDIGNGWRENIVLCQPPGSSANNPKIVSYAGLTTKEQAFREGIYEAEALLKQRKAITFETELEGLIPQKGDLIIVATEDFLLDGGGELVSVSGTTLTADEVQAWTNTSPATVHAIRLRKPNGDVDGPYSVTEGSNAAIMELSAPLSWAPDVSGNTTRAIFQFGTLASTVSQWVVAQIRPLGGNKVSIKALNYVASVHTVDAATPPATNDPAEIATTSDQPVIANLLLENTTNPAIIRAAWTHAPGADEYAVEMSLNSGVDWIHVTTTTSTLVEFRVPQGEIFVRVAGIGKVRGVWKQDSIANAKQYSETSPTALDATAALVLASNGTYQTNIVFSFTAPGDDHLIEAYEAQYQLARHNGAWQSLYFSKEISHEFRTSEIGEHQFRVRSVYVPDEVFSDWAETSVVNLGTYDSIASIGLPEPQDPTLFITADITAQRAEIRLRIGYNDTASPERAVPEFFVLFYSSEIRPNRLAILTDAGAKLYLDASNEDTGIAGSFQMIVTAGSTLDVINFSDAGGEIDIDLSGSWWVSVTSAGSPDLGSTRFFKVFETSATEIKLAPGDVLPWVPAAGDTLEILELDWHDARLDEFKLAYINGEVVNHGGIDFDGQYYLTAVERGAEGTVQADQTGETADYYPAIGPETFSIVLDMSEFIEDADGNLTYTGTIDLNLPGAIEWAAVSCAFFRKGSSTVVSGSPEVITDTNSQYVRSNIVPLIQGGPA